MNKQTRIAITGATGFLGRHLVSELRAQGFDNLLLLVRDTSKVVDCDCVEVELTNPRELADALRGVEVLFHLAARVSFSDSDGKQIIETNVEMSSHLVNAALESGVKKIIYTSSIAALGGMKEGKIYIDEKSILEDFSNTSPYGVSKFLSENQIYRAQSMGIDTVVVNPGVILGEGDTVMSLLSKGLPFYTTGVTGYVDVRDVAKAEVLLMQCDDAVGERFVLVGENLSMRELLAMAGKEPRFHASPALMGLMMRLDTFFARLLGYQARLTRSGVRALQSKSYYNGEKLRTYIDFKYTPIQKTVTRALQKL